MSLKLFLVSMVLTIALTATVLPAMGFTADRADTFDSKHDWCEDRGGELVISNAWTHGGWHCKFPNGTVVHVGDVTATPEATP